MQHGGGTMHYTRIAMALHWLLAAVLICQLMLGWWMLDVPKTPPGVRAGWFNLHKSIGLALAAVVLIRLGWRIGHPPPPHVGLPAWQRNAARANHALLYTCMLLLPLSGYLGSSFSGYPVKFFGAVLPAWAAAWPAGKEWMSALHYTLVWAFMLLVAMHVCAGLWHWLRNDGVAARMGLPHLSRS
jgi:cytochrome b561